MKDTIIQTDQTTANLKTASLTTLEAIIHQVQQGQTDAFGALVERFQDMAVGYSYSILGDFGLAEDAAQDAFLNAYLALAQLRTPAAFPGWFRRIVFKQCDRLVRGKKQLFVPIEHAEGIVDPNADLLNGIVLNETKETVHRAISTLPLHEREVVALFYIGQHSHKEIAAFLELPLSTVKSRLYSARQRLKERILTMIQDTLPTNRPSRDNQFTEQAKRLFQATTSGNVDAVRHLLANNSDLANATGLFPNPLWHTEATALQLAVMYGRKDIVDLLLKHGANIDEPDEKYKFTPLHQALDLGFIPSYRELNMPQFLLDRGAQKDIFAALWSDDLETLQALLKADPSCANAIGPSNKTPLCYAWNVEIAKLLLDHGADMFARVESRSWENHTPLREATGDVLRFLLDHANIDHDLFILCKLGETEKVLAMVEADRSLLEAKTNMDHVLGDGFPLLHLAIVYKQLPIVKGLLALGADVNQRMMTAYDQTPLHQAVIFGPTGLLDPIPDNLAEIEEGGVLRLLPELPRLLLEYGADVTAKDAKKHWTPLQWAEANLEDETDRSEVIALLKAHDEKA